MVSRIILFTAALAPGYLAMSFNPNVGRGKAKSPRVFLTASKKSSKTSALWPVFAAVLLFFGS